MRYLNNPEQTGIQTTFEWVETRHVPIPNYPTPVPADLDRWPGKYAIDWDAGKWVLAPEWDGSTELKRARALAKEDLRGAGFVKIHAVYPPHTQRRLNFKPATNVERKACGEQIEAVRTIVNNGRTAINAATDKAGIEAAKDAALTAIGDT